MFSRLASSARAGARRAQPFRQSTRSFSAMHPMKPLHDFLKLPLVFGGIFVVAAAAVQWDMGRLDQETREADKAEIRRVVKKLLLSTDKPGDLLHQCRPYFNAVNNPNGMNEEQFVDFIEKVTNLKVEPAPWFKTLDMNKEGNISYTEFVAGCVLIGSQIGMPQEVLLRLNFELMDEDKSGTAERGEIKSWLMLSQKLGLAPKMMGTKDVELMTQTIFETFDFKGTGHLSFNQFAAMYDRYMADGQGGLNRRQKTFKPLA